MADSGYFNGSKFRGIDSDAADDSRPFSSVLEAQIANNHQFLHRVGGGSVTRAMGADGAINYYHTNYTSHVSVEWATVMIQPFLITRGLKRIYVDWNGTNEWDPVAASALGVEMMLELRGIATGPISRLTVADPEANVIHSLVLELSESYDEEVETELIFWARGIIDPNWDSVAYLNRVHNATHGYGYFENPGVPHTLTNNHFRGIKTVTFPGGGPSLGPILEPLLRTTAATSPDGDPNTSAVFYNTPVDIVRTVAGEVSVGGLTTRSIVIREEH